jgi:glucosamine--fructose-6-phosphate aminotransferase (isomerizing)
VLDVAAEFRKRGAKVWVAAPGATGDDILPLVATAPISAPLVTVQSFYRATAALALRRGFNPDVPPHLNKVTETV